MHKRIKNIDSGFTKNIFFIVLLHFQNVYYCDQKWVVIPALHSRHLQRKLY